MIPVKYLTTTPHKANSIDKKAIRNLMNYIDFKGKIDESNYIIVICDGYENIAFHDKENNSICEIVQPIDRTLDKLYPIQTIELKLQYKIF